MTALNHWQPSADIKNLLKRAKIIAEIRNFLQSEACLK